MQAWTIGSRTTCAASTTQMAIIITVICTSLRAHRAHARLWVTAFITTLLASSLDTMHNIDGTAVQTARQSTECFTDLFVEQLRDEADVAQRPLLDAPLR